MLGQAEAPPGTIQAHTRTIPAVTVITEIIHHGAVLRSHLAPYPLPGLGNFLSRINKLGASFCLGISLPDLDAHERTDRYRIAVKSSEKDVCRRCLELLENQGYQVQVMENSAVFFRELSQCRPALILVAESRLNESTLEWCRKFSAARHAPPLLVISAQHDADTELRVLQAGAHRYLSFPISQEHLTAHIEVLRRRFAAVQGAHPPAQALLHADPASRRVWAAGSELRLSPALFALLIQFLTHPGQVLTPEVLLASIQVKPRQPHRDVVKAYICHLRKALAPHGLANVICTLHRVGYRYDPPAGWKIH